jgi:hypothetical protein
VIRPIWAFAGLMLVVLVLAACTRAPSQSVGELVAEVSLAHRVDSAEQPASEGSTPVDSPIAITPPAETPLPQADGEATPSTTSPEPTIGLVASSTVPPWSLTAAAEPVPSNTPYVPPTPSVEGAEQARQADAIPRLLYFWARW